MSAVKEECDRTVVKSVESDLLIRLSVTKKLLHDTMHLHAHSKCALEQCACEGGIRPSRRRYGCHCGDVALLDHLCISARAVTPSSST